MSRGAWAVIKQSKRFYVGTYRWAGSMLVFLVVVNLLLGLGVFYTYVTMPDRSYYSTYGETPPVELAGMDAPNYTSTPLLANETMIDSDIRAVPQ